jgi:hypothetical protein
MPSMPFDRILPPYPVYSARIAVAPPWMADDHDSRMKDEENPSVSAFFLFIVHPSFLL